VETARPSSRRSGVLYVNCIFAKLVTQAVTALVRVLVTSGNGWCKASLNRVSLNPISNRAAVILRLIPQEALERKGTNLWYLALNPLPTKCYLPTYACSKNWCMWALISKYISPAAIFMVCWTRRGTLSTHPPCILSELRIAVKASSSAGYWKLYNLSCQGDLLAALVHFL